MVLMHSFYVEKWKKTDKTIDSFITMSMINTSLSIICFDYNFKYILIAYQTLILLIGPLNAENRIISFVRQFI